MKNLIKKLGVSDKEAESFLKLMELGAQPVSVIAKYMDLPRSSMYLVVERLVVKGLVEEFERKGIKYVRCVDPSDVLDGLRATERSFHQTVEEFELKVPELESLSSKLSLTPKVKFFEGKDAVKKMYESVLKEKEFCAFFNPSCVKRVMPGYHYQIPELLRKNRGRARELIIEGADSDEYKAKFSSKMHEIKILKGAEVFHSDTIICKDRIYLISYNIDDASALMIFDASLAKAHRVIFDELWNKCS